MLDTPSHSAVNFNVRIADAAQPEHPGIRAMADRLLEAGGLQPIACVRNTIFPAAWASRLPEPGELAEFYRRQYGTLRRFPKNKSGTYFGRIVEYPMGRDDLGDSFDQLADVVQKLRAETHVKPGGTRARRLSSRYQINIWKPGDIPNGRGFPCLAHLAFHLVEERLHMLAHYRNQYLVERAYGNYLGLAELQRYVAAAAGIATGELMVVAGHAGIDTHPNVSIAVIRAEVAAVSIEPEAPVLA